MCQSHIFSLTLYINYSIIVSVMKIFFQKGDKVRIKSKNLLCTLEQSSIYRIGGGIGYVVNPNYPYGKGICILVGHKEDDFTGDFFKPSDLELYEDDNTLTKIVDNLFDEMINELKLL